MEAGCGWSFEKVTPECALVKQVGTFPHECQDISSLIVCQTYVSPMPEVSFLSFTKSYKVGPLISIFIA